MNKAARILRAFTGTSQAFPGIDLDETSLQGVLEQRRVLIVKFLQFNPTVDGIEHTVEEKSAKGLKKKRRVVKKIPSRIIRNAKGLAIFTSMRSGMAPFGGAGGSGIVIAKLEDGCEWILGLPTQSEY